jgi:hypothetical protein
MDLKFRITERIDQRLLIEQILESAPCAKVIVSPGLARANHNHNDRRTGVQFAGDSRLQFCKRRFAAAAAQRNSSIVFALLSVMVAVFTGDVFVRPSE